MRLEGKYGKSIDGEWLKKHEADEIDYTKDSYDYLFDNEFELDKVLKEYDEINDDDRAALSAARSKSDGIDKLLQESEMQEELWNASDLGKYTIGTPTQEKQEVMQQEQYMKPVSEKKKKKISKDADPVDIEMQKKFEQMAAELEGRF